MNSLPIYYCLINPAIGKPQMKTIKLPLLILLMMVSAVSLAAESVKVTVFNFVRAETDMTMKRYVDQGGFGKFVHVRQPVPIDKQDVIRMNRDALYSIGVFDLSNPVTISKPHGKGRFQSMQIANQDHSMLPVEHGAGQFTLTQELVGTRYVVVGFRTFADPTAPEDIKAANALQDRIKVTQSDPGTFEIPNWDTTSLTKIRDTVNVLGEDISDFSGVFGDKSKLDPILHLLGTAYGWGGNPKEAAMYENVVPEQNDGVVPYTVTVKDVPVDGFWSVTVYNSKGFMEENALGAYSYNNVTAKPNTDGSFTIHFGGDPSQPNYIPIMEGWNYIARMYQPRKEILDGNWTFPQARLVN
jgi:hypothetical protein